LEAELDDAWRSTFGQRIGQRGRPPTDRRPHRVGVLGDEMQRASAGRGRPAGEDRDPFEGPDELVLLAIKHRSLGGGRQPASSLASTRTMAWPFANGWSIRLSAA